MKFADLEFEAMDKAYGRSYKVEGGWLADPCQVIVILPNGLEVSVVRHGASRGHEKGLYEMGVFHTGGYQMMTVDAWRDEVKGWLTPENVEKELEYLENYYKSDKKTA
tara:strand:- start:345 stop:668 length:324 start_codon:yes stop_codon:yes gene_type:complete